MGTAACWWTRRRWCRRRDKGCGRHRGLGRWHCLHRWDCQDGRGRRHRRRPPKTRHPCTNVSGSRKVPRRDLGIPNALVGRPVDRDQPRGTRCPSGDEVDDEPVEMRMDQGRKLVPVGEIASGTEVVECAGQAREGLRGRGQGASVPEEDVQDVGFGLGAERDLFASVGAVPGDGVAADLVGAVVVTHGGGLGLMATTTTTTRATATERMKWNRVKRARARLCKHRMTHDKRQPR